MKAAAMRVRIATTAGVFFMLFLIALGRVFQLCIIDGPALQEVAQRQYRRRLALPSERGPIVDRHGEVLALTMESAAVYADAGKMQPNLIPALARTLELSPAALTAKIRDRDGFVWLHRGATLDQASAVAMLGLPGVGTEPTRRRFYPHGTLAGHVLGFAGVDGQGLEGVELAYDRDLRGAAESLSLERDARGRYILADGGWRPLPHEGARVELTIDASLQQIVENEIQAAVLERHAAAGVAVVMDPATGEILALGSAPRFDPNRVAVSTAEDWRNRVVTDSYEPGSTFKGILAAAAIESGVVQPDEYIYCENGRYPLGRRVIHDHERHGWLTFADVIKQSSNIGAGKIGERLGAERLDQALNAFQFGRPTRVDLPGEVAGRIRSRQRSSRVDVFTTSFGQGISVTPLQLLRAYAAIANGGQLMRPFIVRRVIAANGAVLRESKPEVVARPISARTAHIVTGLLRGVVDGGTGTQAQIEGVAVAGKTGTAQKVDGQTGAYSPRARMSSFVGFLPADAPRFVILVVLDSPQTVTYGGIVAAPVFRRIAEYEVDRLGLRMAAAVPPAPQQDTLPLPPVVASSEGGMPSFIGLSMRVALVQAARAGWQVKTYGSGFVVAQDPPPGTQTGNGRKLELRFGSVIG